MGVLLRMHWARTPFLAKTAAPRVWARRANERLRDRSCGAFEKRSCMHTPLANSLSAIALTAYMMGVGAIAHAGQPAPAKGQPAQDKKASGPAATGEKAMPDLTELNGRVAEFERTMDSFYRQPSMKETAASVNSAVDAFNAWMKNMGTALEMEKAEIEKDLGDLRRLESEIEAADKKLGKGPGGTEAAAVEAHNRAVTERNALVEKHKGMAAAFEQKQTAFNDKVSAFNREAERRRAEVNAAQKNAEDRADAMGRWRESGSERFFGDVNRVYASLLQMKRDGHSGDPGLEGLVARIRKIRAELAENAKTEEKKAEHGLLLVRARLCDAEDVCLMVDTGATVSSVTPEMVDILGIQKYVGEEVELSLPNAIKIKAPQLLLPKISVNGNDAEFVKAVVLRQTMPGVDGCVGLSFMHRFDYAIDKDTLSLHPLKKAEVTPQYDVFISHKSEDLAWARKVYDALTEAGYRPFLSEASLQEMHEAEFQKAIDAVLETATHLVIVASSRQRIESPWVESEWRLFEGMKRSGKKGGNMVNVLSEEMKAGDLPLALTKYQVVLMSDSQWAARLAAFLPKGK